MPARRDVQAPSLVIPPNMFPLDAETWRRIVAALRLPPQQARIAEQLLYGRQDKHIVAVLGIRRPTLRTHLHRLLVRVGASDRTELVVKLIIAARLLDDSSACHHHG